MVKLFILLYQRVSYVMSPKWLLILFFFFSIMCYATTGYMYYELSANPELKWIDAAWWALVTMTTVGYGDFYPVTDMGRIVIGLPTMILGVSLLGYMLSILASIMVESRIMEKSGMKQITFDEHIIICKFNSIEQIIEIVNELKKDPSTNDSKIVLIDSVLEQIPFELKELDLKFVKGNPTRESVLEMANFTEAKYIIILADLLDTENSDNKNLAVALTIERISPKVITIVECIYPENVVMFKRVGCDSVICVPSLTSQMIVQELQDPGIHNVISELTSNKQGKQFYIVDFKGDFKSYSDLKENYMSNNTILIGIQREGKNILMPIDDFSINESDKLIIISKERPV